MTGRAAKTKAAAKPKESSGTKRGITGYILFANENRSLVKDANPGVKFGDISRLVGQQWRELSDAKKQDYVKRAQAQNAQS